MKIPMFIALLVLVGTAFAEKPAKEPGFAWVKGSETPEAVPEWSALRGLQALAISAEGGSDLVRQLTGLSEDGMRAFIAYAQAQVTARTADEAGDNQRHRAALCYRPTTKEQVIAERHRLAEEYQSREKVRAEGVYGALSADDAKKLRVAALQFRKSVTSFGVSDPAKAYSETTNYLGDLCGGAP